MPRPTPGAGQLLLRARASSVNPVDWKIASGKLRPVLSAHFPQVPGFDVAGEVEAVGPRVTGFAPGDRVHARLAGGVGAASAEFTLAGLDVTAKMPDSMDFATAAGLPLAGITALQGLRDRAGMAMEGSKDRVLVVGASGGVGHLAVQIARAAGATVIGVCSGRNAALVSELGAHEIVDYQQPGALDGLAPADIVLDCVGGTPSAWLGHLRTGGRYASVLPGPAVFFRSVANAFSRKKVRAVMLKPNAADLAILDALFVAGKLRVVIDQRFPLASLNAAWERSIGGRAVGKIIVDIGS
jgi:NADPH:quinone reductase-like Zn-dependent oxidoreductase